MPYGIDAAGIEMKQNLRWMKLDNAAKIYPAARRKYWTNVFRLSVTFADEIDPALLQQALDLTVRRFPSVAVRLRTGAFWYYLEQIPEAPRVMSESSCSLNRMTFRSIRRCAFRVLYHQNRISAEFFHSVTDGNGGLVFVKTLAAVYARLRYGADIPCEEGILDVGEEATESELEDSFGRYDSPVGASRREDNAYCLPGSREPDGFLHVTTGILDTDEVLRLAKAHGTTLTVFLAAVMMKAIYEIQNERVPDPRARESVRILIPVNLRKLFDSDTMRNFASYITPGIDPKLGEYSFEEMVSVIHHSMALELNPKKMSAKFTANVRSEQSPILRVMPLFLKNFAMKMVYNCVGEKKSSICLSNLGAVRLPEALAAHVRRIDFVLGVQAKTPCNCGVCSYGGKLYINFIRNIRESELERRFFTELRRRGLHILIESNQREERHGAPKI